MQVTISNIEFEVENSPAGANELFARIDESMKDFQVYFSHLVVDGIEVTDFPQDYITNNVETIKAVEVIFLTPAQYLEQTMSIMNAFLEQAVPTLREVADEFYGRPDDDSWARLEAGMQGVTSLLGVISAMVSDRDVFGDTEDFAQLGESIGLHLENLKNAATLDDYTLMADILQYELVGFLEKLHDSVAVLVRRHADVTH